MKCKHGIEEDSVHTCAFCEPCRLHKWTPMATCPKCSGTDDVIYPKGFDDDEETFRKNVDDLGAWYWYTQACFWSEKFFGVSDDLRKMQEKRGDS